MHIATDGETYGHHHRHGDMALAYALDRIESRSLRCALTNYGEFLEMHPPTHEVEIIENTAWSCAHGVERWRSDCGCNSGGSAGGTSMARRRCARRSTGCATRCAALFEKRGGELLHDPWAARNDYIDVVLDRSPNR